MVARTTNALADPAVIGARNFKIYLYEFHYHRKSGLAKTGPAGPVPMPMYNFTQGTNPIHPRNP